MTSSLHPGRQRAMRAGDPPKPPDPDEPPPSEPNEPYPTRAAIRYVFSWGNNPRRAALKGRVCVIEAAGGLGTVLVSFCDTGERVTTSRRALRRAKPNI